MRAARMLSALSTPLSSGLAMLSSAYRDQRAAIFGALMKLDGAEPLASVTAQLCTAETMLAAVVEVDHVVSDLMECARRVGEHYKLLVETAMAGFVRERSDLLLTSYVTLETCVSNLGEPRFLTGGDMTAAFERLGGLFRDAFDACAFLGDDVPATAMGQWSRVLSMRSPKFAQVIGPAVPEDLRAAVEVDLAARVSAASRPLAISACEHLLAHPSMCAFVHAVRLRSYYLVASSRGPERDVDKVAFGAHLFTPANFLLGENERQRILTALPLVDGDTPQQVFLAFARAYAQPGKALQTMANRLDDVFSAMQTMPGVLVSGDAPDDHVIVMMTTLFLALCRVIPREHWWDRVGPASLKTSVFFRQLHALSAAPPMAPLMMRTLVALVVGLRAQRILGRAPSRGQLAQLFSDDARACRVESSGMFSSGHWTFHENRVAAPL